MRIRGLTFVVWVATAVVAVVAGCAAHRDLRDTGTVAPSAKSELLGRRCGGCHAVPDPASMSAEKWTAAIERMKRRMELPAAEWDSLTAMAGH